MSDNNSYMVSVVFAIVLTLLFSIGYLSLSRQIQRVTISKPNTTVIETVKNNNDTLLNYINLLEGQIVVLHQEVKQIKSSPAHSVVKPTSIDKQTKKYLNNMQREIEQLQKEINCIFSILKCKGLTV